LEENMKVNRLAGLVLGAAIPFLCQCSNCPDPNSYEAQVQNAVGDAIHFVAGSFLGPFAGSRPPRAGGPDDPACNAAIDDSPGVLPSGLVTHPPSDVCTASHDVDDPCAACVLTNCCTEVVTCLGHQTCACNLAQHTPGANWPEDATCESADEVADKALACLSAHCAAECPMK
jgi:hypothetical protein